MSANLNIPRDVKDQFYRYKMERLQAKVEGKGNGIKTVVVNLSNVAHQLARPGSYVIKYFGFELGAQTNIDPADDRWIINGAHEASKLQDYLDGFISKFVLCRKCRNPETVTQVKDGLISLNCKACGHISDVDLRLKLSSFILKNQPKKGKKDKSNKKAERKARKLQQQANGDKDDEDDDDDEDGSPHGSNRANDENGDNDDGDVGVEAGSDDELTRRINAEAKDIDAPFDDKEIEWSVDTSAEAVAARAKGLPDDLKRSLVIEGGEDGEDGEGGASNYEVLGSWIENEAKTAGGVANVDSVEIYKKAQELGMEKKHRTLTVLAQALFDEGIVTKKQIEPRVAMLKKMITSEKHEKAFLGGTERLVGVDHPDLVPAISTILMQYYQYDLIEEATLKAWGSKASKKYVDSKISKQVRKSAEKFMQWLETAESEEDDDDEEDDDE